MDEISKHKVIKGFVMSISKPISLDESLKLIENVLSSTKQFKLESNDYGYLWKGLFYSIWYTEMGKGCESIIAKLCELANSKLIIHGFLNLNNDWFNIDYIRIDKYMYLTRKLTNKLILIHLCQHIKFKKLFNEGKLDKQIMQLKLKKTNLLRRSLNVMNGVGLIDHFLDIYYTECFKIISPLLGSDKHKKFVSQFLLLINKTLINKLSNSSKDNRIFEVLKMEFFNLSNHLKRNKYVLEKTMKGLILECNKSSIKEIRSIGARLEKKFEVFLETRKQQPDILESRVKLTYNRKKALKNKSLRLQSKKRKLRMKKEAELEEKNSKITEITPEEQFNELIDLNGYIYGLPPKTELENMQIQLRTYTGDKYLLLKVNEPIKNQNNINLQSEKLTNKKKFKKNELVVSIELLFTIFKKFQSDPLIDIYANENFVLELEGYDFNTILIITYALYSNQLYLTLSNFPKILEISLDLGISPILKLIKQLAINDDVIYLMFKLRNCLSEFDALFNFEMIHILKQVVTNYKKIICHPAILELNFDEINFLVWKKKEIFKLFNVSESRNEFEVIRAILDWYMVANKSRINQSICLLNKINYENLTDDQLDKLVNYFPLNNYSDDVKKYLKDKLNHELNRREIFCDYFQDMIKSRASSCPSLNEKIIIKEKPIEVLNKKMLTSLKTTTKKDIDFVERESNLKNLFDDLIQKSIHLGSFSLIASLSPIYSINKKSIMLLFGGFKSYVPYSKDQGRLMYHLIETQLNYNLTPTSLPSILSHDWFPLQERLPQNLAHFASIRILYYIFIFGGLDLNYLLSHNKQKQVRPVSTCYFYNLKTNSWHKIKSMNLNRAFHCAIEYDNLVYVFGGISHSQNNSLIVNNLMEFYDISKNNWFLVYDHLTSPIIIPSPRMAFGMELIDSNTICIIGGISKLEDKNLNYNSSSVLNDFWCFNLKTKRFSPQPHLNLPNPRASFGLIRHHDELLLIGGIECCGLNSTQNIPVIVKNVLSCKIEMIKKIDKFIGKNFKICGWNSHSKLNQQRIFPLVGKCFDTILVADGKTCDHVYLKNTSLTNYCSSYEVLNNETLKWIECPKLFSSVGSCLISLI